jgi:hypothetical protein
MDVCGEEDFHRDARAFQFVTMCRRSRPGSVADFFG